MPAKNSDGDRVHLHHHQPRLELFRRIAHEVRPMRSARHDAAQVAHHLAAVAHAKRERVRAREEGFELFTHRRIEQDRLGPAFSGAEHVSIREAAAGDKALEFGERPATRGEVAHVHVVGIEPGAIERGRHFHVAIHTLLAQDRDLGPRAGRDERRGDVAIGIEGQVRREAGIIGVEDARVLFVRDDGIVAQPLHRVGRRRPRAVKVDPRLVEHCARRDR